MYQYRKEEMGTSVHTDGVTLQQVIAELEGNGAIRTLRDFFESSSFATVRTAQNPDAVKDSSHPADYLWPPSIHSWYVGQCRSFAAHVRGILSAEHGDIPYLHSLIEDDPVRFSKDPRDIDDTFIFASGDKCRAYHPHTHNSPNHSLLLILRGKKRMVTWPVNQNAKLYPLTPGGLGANDTDKQNELLFMVDGFNVDLQRQPDLRQVKGGLEAEAGVGDLMYIPCGLVHALESVGNMIAIGWLPTKETMFDSTDSTEGTIRMERCPNTNAYE